MSENENAYNTFDAILLRQKGWAGVNGIPLDGRRKTPYVLELGENLFNPISASLLKEFDTGGGETRDHMKALHSSSALVVNFFQSWRNKKALGDLGDYLFDEPNLESLCFEASFPTGLGGIPPHLDVLLQGNMVKPIAIESKFTEPYAKALGKPKIPKAYFSDDLWKELPKCYKLLQAIQNGDVVFKRLDAVQLIKHTLGLSKHFNVMGFRLFLFWYDIASEEAETMAKEIEVFKSETMGEIDFHTVTYQDAILALESYRAKYSAYFNYMCERYFDSGLTLRLTDLQRDVFTLTVNTSGIKVDDGDERLIASFEAFENIEGRGDLPDFAMSLTKPEMLKMKQALDWVVNCMHFLESSDVGSRLNISFKQD